MNINILKERIFDTDKFDCSNMVCNDDGSGLIICPFVDEGGCGCAQDYDIEEINNTIFNKEEITNNDLKQFLK